MFDRRRASLRAASHLIVRDLATAPEILGDVPDDETTEAVIDHFMRATASDAPRGRMASGVLYLNGWHCPVSTYRNDVHVYDSVAVIRDVVTGWETTGPEPLDGDLEGLRAALCIVAGD